MIYRLLLDLLTLSQGLCSTPFLRGDQSDATPQRKHQWIPVGWKRFLFLQFTSPRKGPYEYYITFISFLPIRVFPVSSAYSVLHWFWGLCFCGLCGLLTFDGCFEAFTDHPKVLGPLLPDVWAWQAGLKRSNRHKNHRKSLVSECPITIQCSWHLLVWSWDLDHPPVLVAQQKTVRPTFGKISAAPLDVDGVARLNSPWCSDFGS